MESEGTVEDTVPSEGVYMMSREDYLTHVILAAAFFGVLSPYLVREGMVLGTGLYYAGTGVHLGIASAARFWSKKEGGL